jgi:hypothetical protein
LIIACRLERCGSSVYVQKKWSSTEEVSGGEILAGGASVAAVDDDAAAALAADTRRCGEAVSTTEGMVNEGVRELTGSVKLNEECRSTRKCAGLEKTEETLHVGRHGRLGWSDRLGLTMETRGK